MTDGSHSFSALTPPVDGRPRQAARWRPLIPSPQDSVDILLFFKSVVNSPGLQRNCQNLDPLQKLPKGNARTHTQTHAGTTTTTHTSDSVKPYHRRFLLCELFTRLQTANLPINTRIHRAFSARTRALVWHKALDARLQSVSQPAARWSRATGRLARQLRASFSRQVPRQ